MAQLKIEIIAAIRANIPLKRALEDYFGTEKKPMSTRNLDRWLTQNNKRLTELKALQIIGSRLHIDLNDLTQD